MDLANPTCLRLVLASSPLQGQSTASFFIKVCLSPLHERLCQRANLCRARELRLTSSRLVYLPKGSSSRMSSLVPSSLAHFVGKGTAGAFRPSQSNSHNEFASSSSSVGGSVPCWRSQKDPSLPRLTPARSLPSHQR